MKNSEQSANPGTRRGLAGVVDRWTSISRRTRLILVAVGVPLLLVLTGGGFGIHHHVQSNPNFCFGACHAQTAQAGMPLPGAHQGIACERCHELRFWQSASQWIKGPGGETPHAKVTPKRCGSCHTDNAGSKLQIAATVGHQLHGEAQNIGCAPCHGSKTHDLAPKQEACATCHAGSKMHEAGMADLPCLSCHNFLAKGSKLAKAPSTECRACHGGQASPQRSKRFAFVKQGRDVSTKMIHGNIFACSLCHQPHEEKMDKRRTGLDCSRCHSRAPQSAAAISNPAHSACGSCHAVHSARSDLAGSCARCHEMARPEATKGTTAGKHPGCGSCHAAHEFQANRADCVQCHRDQSPLAGVERLKAHADCGNCHAPHRPAAEHEACSTCHQEKRAHGHANCVTCHDPHKDKSSTKQCVTCHGGQSEALVAGRGGHGGGCQTCHAPHAAGGASQRCASCHLQQAGKVATAGAKPHGNCSSCHKPHAFATANAASTCTGCHKLDTSGAHKGECRQCHQPHGNPRIGAESCVKCHAGIPKPQAGKHAECRSCHQPHQPAATGAASCPTCHSGQQAAARAWPASQHQACPGCHQQHNPSQTTPCAQCHGKQAGSSAGGKHQCSACHSPHQAPGNWWGRCTKCHAGQAAAVKGRGATHGSCEACHKPHKFSKPTCQACHNAMGRLGAHGRSGHANCTACHGSHAKSSPTRATCLSCHKDMSNHNPNAASCTGCHLFN